MRPVLALLAALLTAPAFAVDADTDGVDAATDCDDLSAAVYPGAVEACDRLDNNCDGQIDEPTDLTPDVDAVCVWFSVDQDADGWGTSGVTATDRLCICPAYEAVAFDLSGAVVDVAPPRVCEHHRPGATEQIFYGHRIGGRCWVANSTDCDDFNVNIKPFAPGMAPYELLDGVDNDCDGRVPTFELDCDDDGAWPYLPLMTSGLLADPAVTPIENATQVGLAPCTDAPATLSCWGQSFALACDPTTDLWVVEVEALTAFRRYEGSRRTAITTPCGGAWDCDDQCPARCDDAEEVCDGIDNDCNGFAAAVQSAPGELVAADLDGIPDTIDGAARPGLISASDVLGGTCDTTGAQDVVTLQQCVEAQGDARDEGDDVVEAAPGCGCATDASPWTGAPLLALLALRRRRR